jgi:ABC-type long-subunit fatty acid transport system fused permease/ATPase subunit
MHKWLKSVLATFFPTKFMWHWKESVEETLDELWIRLEAIEGRLSRLEGKSPFQFPPTSDTVHPADHR